MVKMYYAFVEYDPEQTGGTVSDKSMAFFDQRDAEVELDNLLTLASNRGHVPTHSFVSVIMVETSKGF